MLVSLMGSSILGEVDDTSILRTELSNDYWDPLDRLPVYRLLLPAQRAGAQRLCALTHSGHAAASGRLQRHGDYSVSVWVTIGLAELAYIISEG
jgi:hypothetical protein